MSFDNQFTTLWSSEFSHEFQQTESRLRKSVTTGTSASEVYNERTMGSVTSVDDPDRFSEMTPSDSDTGIVPIYTKVARVHKYIDDIDPYKSGLDAAKLRADVSKELVAELNRKIDQRIIDALNTSTATEITTSPANTYNSDCGGQAAAALMAMDAYYGEENALTCVYSPGAFKDIAADTKLTSKDYVDGGVISAGKIPFLFGFNHIPSNLLPVSTAGKRRNFWFHKRAVKLIFNKEPTVMVERVSHRASWIVYGTVVCNAAIVRPEGVTRAQIDD